MTRRELFLLLPAAVALKMRDPYVDVHMTVPTYHVTNLQDDGAGSFRYGLESGAKHIVCDVSGTINLESDIQLGAPVHVDSNGNRILLFRKLRSW